MTHRGSSRESIEGVVITSSYNCLHKKGQDLTSGFKYTNYFNWTLNIQVWLTVRNRCIISFGEKSLCFLLIFF